MSTLETHTTSTLSESRHKGHVKFFNSIKGYGFILPDIQQEGDTAEEVFVHHTAIQNSGGFKSLAEGEQVEYDLVQGPKGMQASNVTGPNGSSVQGDPRTHRQQYPSGNNGYRNNNIGGPYSGGYMMDPFGSSFGYGVQGYPFMNAQQMYGGPYGGQPSLPPQFHQYGYVPPTPNSTGSPIDTNPVLSPQLLQQSYNSGGYTTMPMYPNYPQYENNMSPRQQQTSIAHPINKSESPSLA